jgi:hypothetical protein
MSLLISKLFLIVLLKSSLISLLQSDKSKIFIDFTFKSLNSLDAITWEHVGTIEFSSGPVIPHEGEKQMNCHWSFGDQDEWLISPEFTMPTGATLTFWTYLTLGSTNGDHYYVKVSTDGGTTWTEVWDGSTEPAGPNHYDAAINVDLSTYGGQDVKVAWHAYAIGGMW